MSSNECGPPPPSPPPRVRNDLVTVTPDLNFIIVPRMRYPIGPEDSDPRMRYPFYAHPAQKHENEEEEQELDDPRMRYPMGPETFDPRMRYPVYAGPVEKRENEDTKEEDQQSRKKQKGNDDDLKEVKLSLATDKPTRTRSAARSKSSEGGKVIDKEINEAKSGDGTVGRAEDKVADELDSTSLKEVSMIVKD